MDAADRPALRGVLHQVGFFASVPAGAVLVAAAGSTRATVAAAIFAAAVAVMFGASALYHRIAWSPARRVLMRKLDRVGIFALIAATYTPFGLLALPGAWRVAVLAVVWGGAGAAIVSNLVRIAARDWITAAAGVALGWVGVLAFPQLVRGAGAVAASLVLAGGVLYTLGAAVYARRRPDPIPSTFGYHELFHALTLAAVALQYVAVAAVVVPR